MKVKIVKWQQSTLGNYYEFQIQVEFLEGNALVNLSSQSLSRETTLSRENSFVIDTSIFKWVVYKRYTNFEDLHA
jgi:hypothetical protein